MVGVVGNVNRLTLSHPDEQQIYVAKAQNGGIFTSIAARLTAGFALLALVLALIGVYGVMSYVVAQRTLEIGIRMALGAARGEVVRLVLGRGLRIVAAGTTLGLVAAYAGARVIERQLFGVAAADLTTFVSVPIVLVAVAALACWVPARRAARVDPAIALSAE